MDLVTRLNAVSYALIFMIVVLVAAITTGYVVRKIEVNWGYFKRNWYSINKAMLICLMVFSLELVLISAYKIYLGK